MLMADRLFRLEVRRARILPSAALLLLVAVAEPADAQDVVIDSRISCPSCSIQVSRVGTLGGPSSRDRITGPPWIATRLRSGNYLIKNQDDGGELNLFDRSGRWLRQIGRPGGGPGEYRDVSAVELVAGDSIWIFDPPNSRITVLSPEFDVVRTLPLGVYVESAVVFPPGSAVVNAQFRSAGFPLHLVGRNMAPTTSFGSEDPVHGAEAFVLNRRRLARGAGPTVWSAHYQAFIIEQYDIAERLHRRIIRDADWFGPQAISRDITPDQPPLPKITSIRFDSTTHHLWIAILVAAPDHHLAFGPQPQQIEGRPLHPVVAHHALYDSIIEVIDVRRGFVIARHRIPDMFVRWSGGDEFVTYRQDDSGIPLLSIWRARLHTRERRD